MYDFLKFVDELRHRMAFHLEIYYSKIMDWHIEMYRKGCGKDYPNSMQRWTKETEDEPDALMVSVNNSDIELCFAAAHVALKTWLLENDGGY